jgi:hypothetical protein
LKNVEAVQRKQETNLLQEQLQQAKLRAQQAEMQAALQPLNLLQMWFDRH